MGRQIPVTFLFGNAGLFGLSLVVLTGIRGEEGWGSWTMGRQIPVMNMLRCSYGVAVL
jgi:hypothetical protein